jgi:uncharacterized protein YdaU (DUF1376 family)
LNYFEFYVGDYARDTTHLTLVEHGAYLMLMASYYGGEKPLAADLPTLYRIARAMTKDEQKAVRAIAEQFFPVDVDGLRHNRRADDLIAKALARIETARTNGGKGGRPKKGEIQAENVAKSLAHGALESDAVGTPSSDEIANGINGNQNPAGNPAGFDPLTQRKPAGKAHQTPYTKELIESYDSTAPADAGTVGGHRHPPCPQAEIIAAYHELLPELPPVNDWPDVSATHLRNLWRKSAKRQVVAWWRELFAYVRTSDFLMGEKTDFQASLGWLVKPANFAKVVNGTYDNRRRA